MAVVTRDAWKTAVSNLYVVNVTGDIEADEVLARLLDLADSNSFDPLGGLFVPDSATTPFADNAARDTWAAANLGDLIQNRTVVVVTGTPDNNFFLWTGATNPASYVNTNWADVTPLIQGPPGAAGSPGAAGAPGRSAFLFGSIADRTTFFSTQANRDLINEANAVSIVTEPDGTSIALYIWKGVLQPTTYNDADWREAEIATLPGTLRLGDVELHSASRALTFTDSTDELNIVVANTFDTTNGINQFFANQITIQPETVVAAVDTSTLTSPQEFTLPTVTNDTFTVAYRIKPATTGSLRVQAWLGTDDTGPDIVDEVIEVVSADTTNPNGKKVPIINGILRRAVDSVFVRLTGVSLLGGLQTTGDFTGQTVPFLAFNSHIVNSRRLLDERDALTVQDEGTPLTTPATTLNFTGAGVTVTGNTETKTIDIPGGGGGSALTIQDEGSSLATAAASLNFTGAGVTASGAGPNKTIEIPGAGSATITVQDEGGTLTGAASTLNFTGAGVTASGNAATKTIEIPGGSGITIEDEGVALANLARTLNFVGTGVTVTGDTAEKTITITAAVGQAQPSIHGLTMGIASRVDIGTDLNVQTAVTFDVSNFALLTALNLIVTDGDNKALTLPIRDGVQTQQVDLTGINTGSARTLTFQLSGTWSGGTITSNIVTVSVANLQQQEQSYYGSRGTDDFATAPLSALTAVDVTASGTVYTIEQQVPNGGFLGIISINNRDPISIVNLASGVDDFARGRFTATTNIRTIGGLSANLLTIQNNSGVPGTFRYRVTTE